MFERESNSLMCGPQIRIVTRDFLLFNSKTPFINVSLAVLHSPLRHPLDEIAAIFTRKFGDPYPEMSYSEEGYRSETWIREDMLVYSVYWDPENHSIDINIMIYTD